MNTLKSKYYTIYDTCNKSCVYDKSTGTFENGFRDMKILKFKTHKAAEYWKNEDLSSGNYPDFPHTVYEIMYVFGFATLTLQFQA